MVGSDGDVSVIVCSDHISSWPSGQESSRLFFSLCNLKSRSRVSVTAGLKDVDRIRAERLQGDGRLEDNVFISSYSHFCQLGSCAIREGRLKERETVSLKPHAPLAAAVNQTRHGLHVQMSAAFVETSSRVCAARSHKETSL